MSESRTKNSVRNISFSIIAYFIQVVLSFLLRRLFILYFSNEYLGLNSLFANILSFLSLAELGFGSAIVFAMYKPMADGDNEKVKSLLAYYKKCYFIVGCIVFVLGLAVIPFMDYIKAQAPGVDVNFYVIYLIYLTNSALSYFCAHRRSLLYADQRNDIESKVSIIANLTFSVLKILAVCLMRNFYLYIFLLGVGSLAENLIIYLVTNKRYPEIVKRTNSRLDKISLKEINKNIRALFLHRLGGAIVYSTDSLIIYLVINAATLGIYSNYLMITNALNSLIVMFMNALRNSIGNSVASQDVEKNYKLFHDLNFIYMWIVGFCTIGVFVLSNQFIKTILYGSSNEALFSWEVVLLIAGNFYFNYAKVMVQVFKDSAGLFYQDRFKPLFEAVINLVVSLVLVKYIGLLGVIIGTIASNVLVALWVEPLVLHKSYFKKKQTRYWLNYLYYFWVMIVAGSITYFVCSMLPSVGLLWLIVKFAIVAVLPNIIFLILYFKKKEFKYLKDLIRGLLFKKNRG